MRIPAAALLFVIALGLLRCDSLLFPDTESIDLTATLDTPEAVINQLETAYSHRSTQMLARVFCTPADSFRFYIPVDPTDRWENIPPTRTEDVDVPTALVTKGKYIYLTSADETDVLRHLFEQASEVSIQTLQPTTTYLVDTLFADSASVDSAHSGVVGFDTTGAVVHTGRSSITITAERLRSVYGSDKCEFKVGEQVFIMQRKSDRSWGIRYWFELPM